MVRILQSTVYLEPTTPRSKIPVRAKNVCTLNLAVTRKPVAYI